MYPADQPNPARGFIVGVLLLYAASWFVPAWVCHGKPVLGWKAFSLGLCGCVMGSAGVVATLLEGGKDPLAGMFPVLSWVANPLLWLGLLYLGSRQCGKSFAAGVVATGLALGFLLLLRKGELQVSCGYFGWVGSMVLLAAGRAVGLHHEARNREAAREFTAWLRTVHRGELDYHESEVRHDDRAGRVAPGHPPPGPPRAGL